LAKDKLILNSSAAFHDPLSPICFFGGRENKKTDRDGMPCRVLMVSASLADLLFMEC
jgi:hypothetical protein